MGVISTALEWQKHPAADPGVHSPLLPSQNALRGNRPKGLQLSLIIIITRQHTTCYDFACARTQHAKTSRQFLEAHGSSEVTGEGRSGWQEISPSIVAQQTEYQQLGWSQSPSTHPFIPQRTNLFERLWSTTHLW